MKQPGKSQESGGFWKALTRSITSPTSFSNVNERRQELLGELRPLPGIQVVGLNSRPEDSTKLISPDVSSRVISLAMVQLLDEATTKPDAVVLNNLGCAYTWLDRYNEAKDTLVKAIFQARSAKDEEAEKAAFHNLGIVARISVN